MIKVVIANKKNNKNCVSCNRSHYSDDKNDTDEIITYFCIETYTDENSSNASVMTYCDDYLETLRCQLNMIGREMRKALNIDANKISKT